MCTANVQVWSINTMLAWTLTAVTYCTITWIAHALCARWFQWAANDQWQVFLRSKKFAHRNLHGSYTDSALVFGVKICYICVICFRTPTKKTNG